MQILKSSKFQNFIISDILPLTPSFEELLISPGIPENDDHSAGPGSPRDLLPSENMTLKVGAHCG